MSGELRIIVEADKRFESENYIVSFYEKSPQRIAVVFASAGKWGAGGPIEEFKNTIIKTGISVIFVICKGIEWYNNQETLDVIEILSDFVERYDHCCALGESMGGSGALMFARYCNKVSRILSFAPQFSVRSPFVEMDNRYKNYGTIIKNHLHGDFAFEKLADRAVIIFG